MGNVDSQDHSTIKECKTVVGVIPPPMSGTFSDPVSELYKACRENRIEDVKRMLEKASLSDINRIEPLQSTALHAAAYYGHGDIVKLLLKKGACRTIQNRHGYTPYEEARTVEIRNLFLRTSDKNRFDGYSASMEWIIVDSKASHHALKYKTNEANWFSEVCSNSDGIYLSDIKDYINTKLAHIDGVDQIRYFIDQASRTNKVEPVLKAYSAETGFYDAINADLTSINTVNFNENNDEKTRDEYFRYWHGPGGYAAMIAHHPSFQKYSFIGITYRGVNMSKEEMSMYKVDTIVVNKSLMSASTEKQIAAQFALQQQPARLHANGHRIKYPVLCEYRIRNTGTALSIEKISEYPDEKEVLITPRAVFRVVSMKKRSLFHGSIKLEIIFRECNPLTDKDSNDTNEFEDDLH